jgi:hypothetical protein
VILAVSHRGDGHAAAVLRELRRRGAPARLLDLSALTARGALTIEAGGASPARAELRLPGLRLAAAEVGAVWWRRPAALLPRPGLSRPSHRAFALREWSEALEGLLRLLPCRWVNDPAREAVASRKALQLERARQAGLAVPRTCITSDPARARAFLAGLAPASAVYKALAAAPGDWRETRRVGPAERALLGALPLAPVILQEEVAGTDVRVTAVGRRLFATAIDARRTRYPLDFRLDLPRAEVRPARLPRAVAAGLRSLLDGLGLAFAAVDLRRTAAGEHLFLEVNPAGQWLFLEARTGQPITAALAGLLAGRPRPG